ncbi:MAG: LysR family transcriptional regulator [Pseudobdellovibrionaceae bacterium]
MKHSELEYLKEFPLFRDEAWQFAIVAKEKNISKAAEFIGITQPQLSKAMAALESRMGETLLLRRSRGVELTSSGEALMEQIQSISHFFSEASDSESRFQRARIGFHHTIAMQVYPRIIHQMHLKDAKFKVETQFGTSLEITRLVADLQMDFGFVINPQKNPDIVAKKLESDTVGIFSQGKAPANGVLYYHPSMIYIHRVLKKADSFTKIPLADYEVIAETVRSQSNALGVLPKAVADRYGLNLSKDGALFSVDLMLIAHRDRLKLPRLKKTFQDMQEIFSK